MFEGVCEEKNILVINKYSSYLILLMSIYISSYKVIFYNILINKGLLYGHSSIYFPKLFLNLHFPLKFKILEVVIVPLFIFKLPS